MNDLSLDLKPECRTLENTDRTIHKNAWVNPTDAIYQQLKIPFVHFNKHLFGGELPDCVLTLSHKNKRTLGYFRPDGFKHKDGSITDEIAMNPRIFHFDDLPYVLSVIAHEQAHMWKHHFGKTPVRSGYHCKEWGAKMHEIGLPPSNTGQPGGKRTGYQMMHYIEKDGPFDIACRKLLAEGFAMSWGFAQQRVINRKNDLQGAGSKGKNKTKYTCTVCGLNAWAKPQARLACVTCSVLMKEVIR
ncbi:MAG: SprT-like domain-containing protein [Candidatus Thiodiazotropha sp. (ex Lucina pensylvanica)]|nr:SprT-like domain-containing protein [Candidatus Thiodiazotropha sp. (ex Lucina pensylvanica)]